MSAKTRTTGNTWPHLTLWLMVGLVAAFAAWSYLGRLDVVATAYGEVVPSTQVKSVEHLEGGIVREILVREGQRVTADQALVSLDPVRTDADVRELKVRITDLAIDVARLEAESAGANRIDFPETLVETSPDLLARARDLFDSRRARLDNMIAAQRERIAQRSNEIAAIEQRIRNNRNRLKLVREQIEISEGLMQDQLSNRMNHLDLLKEAAALEARVADDRQALPRARSALAEGEAQMAAIGAEYLEKVRETLSLRRGEMREAEARLRKLQDALSRTVLRAPVDGVVKTVHVATVGGVVRPGEPVIDVVPGSDRLVIEAKLPTQDVGYVRPGQAVQVTLASADAIRFGHIDGEVVNVSPDAIDSQDGIPYYKVRVETERSQFDSDAVTFELVPGVQVACAIRTGERTVIAYLLDPFLTSARTAMRER